jgi:hypothetical protein
VAQIGKVPSEWINPEVNKQKSLTSFSALNQLDDAYNNILEAKMDILNNIPDDSHKRWFLQSIRTEIAIEAGGTIGVMGVGGEAALELVWIKKNKELNNKNLIRTFDEEINPETEDIQITGEMTEESLKAEIAPIVDFALSSGNIRKRRRLFNGLLREALKFQETIRELETAPAMGPWYAYKYQLELYVSAEGKISPIVIGNSVRLRLEWWKLKKAEPAPFVAPLLPEELSPNAKFVTSIASDLSVMDEVPFDNGFKLNVIKAGVGTTVKGNLYFVKGKARAVGSIFFKRDLTVPAAFTLPTLVDEVTTYSMVEKDVITEVPRFSFRNGMKKAAGIAKFFASRAKTREVGQFELNVIEAEFELFTSGGVGIVSVEGASLLTVFVTRNVTI